MSEHSEHEELLPCPFCGSEARLYPAHDGSGFESVGCSNHDCEFEPSTDYAELNAAIGVWNKRETADTIEALSAENTALCERVKVLEDALIECEEYFDQRADAEYTTDSSRPIANCEMNYLVTVRAALKGGE